MLEKSFVLGRQAIRTAYAFGLVYRPIVRGSRHSLPTTLIVSLTSYPPRFRTLARTIRSLLNQSVSPDRLILWIADTDIGKLPVAVSNLRDKGLEIKTCPDWRSLKKIAPALLEDPQATIVTADDDLYYRRDWLKRLVDRADGTIIAHDVRKPVRQGDRYAPFAQWLHWPGETAAGLYVTTGPGVLFPPGALHPDTVDFETFSRLCPTCDDSWLTWQAARAGTTITESGQRDGKLIAWERTVKGSLYEQNLAADGGRTVHAKGIARLVAEYGSLDECIERQRQTGDARSRMKAGAAL